MSLLFFSNSPVILKNYPRLPNWNEHACKTWQIALCRDLKISQFTLWENANIKGFDQGRNYRQLSPLYIAKVTKAVKDNFFFFSVMVIHNKRLFFFFMPESKTKVNPPINLPWFLPKNGGSFEKRTSLFALWHCCCTPCTHNRFLIVKIACFLVLFAHASPCSTSPVFLSHHFP